MSTTEIAVDANVMDFSLGRTSIKFKIDDDVFEAAPDLATELALVFADQADRLQDKNISSDEQVKTTHSLVRLLLFPESADRFIARLGDARRPIGPATFTKVIKWLFEEYGMRPTTPASNSSTGLEVPLSGTSSTATALAAGSTSSNFASTDS